MSVGLCLVSHNRVGEALVETATSMLGKLPLPVTVVSVPSRCDPEAILTRAKVAIAAIDQGDGVIVLTDMFGSTPSNIATALQQEHEGAMSVIAGINLPMLIRLMNYPGLNLEQLTDKALSGGQAGIFRCDPQGGRL